MKILIAGAGMGGLTAALCLHQAGFDVEVFESAAPIKPLGVGINILPHAVRVLTNLGLEAKLAAAAVATRELVYFNKFGQQIWQEPRGKFAGYNWSQFSIHRGTLQLLLLEAVQTAIGADKIHLGHHLLSAENVGHQVVAKFVNRETNEMIAEVFGDALIGADGIHSALRQQFYPREGEPKFSGMILHRGVTKTKPFLTGSSMIMSGHARQKFTAYPIIPIPDADGNVVINWIADLPLSTDEKDKERDWNKITDKAKLLPAFARWNFDWLDVPALIDGAEAIYEFPMSDRDPLERWSFGRITLLGDAAHPMYPIGSNGASQAILDAEALTAALTREADVVTALQNYEANRLPATAKIVLQNRQNGPEQIMQVVEELAPNGFEKLGEVISYSDLEAIANQYKQIAGFAKDTLNQKK